GALDDDDARGGADADGGDDDEQATMVAGALAIVADAATASEPPPVEPGVEIGVEIGAELGVESEATAPTIGDDQAAPSASPDAVDPTDGERAAGDPAAGDPVPMAAPTASDLQFTEELTATSAPGAETGPETVSSAPATQTMPAAVVQPAGSSRSGAVFDDEPRRRRKGPIVLAVLVLLAGLGALGYAATLLLQPNSFAVPVLAGQPVQNALNQIAGNGWAISYEFERSDSFPEPQQVIRTTPEPGAEVEEGEPFVLVLSEGPEFRTLPELVERTFDDAAAELAALGLNVTEAAEREFSETLEVGAVVSWQVIGNSTLVAGQQILPRETIELTLSAGPEPRVVPSFAGLSLGDATAQAEVLGLVVVSGEGVFSDDVPEGLVVSQSPADGEQLDRGGTITVELSLGPDVVPLPSLDGLSFTEAEALLDEAGFVIGRLLGTTEGVFVELTIDGAEVAPGTEFPRGTVVDVIFL
ncbi:MAG: PASTA domain-containing protein, partial [Actinomycetota bacterium]